MNFLGLAKTTLCLIGIFTIYILKQGGFFKVVHPHFLGKEEIVKSPPGVEDITTDLVSGTSYLSSHDRREFDKNGAIYTLKVSDTKPIKMFREKIGIPFNPHGISLLKTKENQFLFIVNHENRDQSSIVRYTIKGDSLLAPKVFTHSLITYPNDCEAVSSASFYVTNDHNTPKGLKRALGDYVLKKDGNVVFYKNGEAAVISLPHSYPNGIRLSKDKKNIFVAATTEKTLFVYQHSSDFMPRKKVDQLHLNTSPDNIEIDKFGYLWIASHPKLLKFVAHARDSLNKSPSQILKVEYLPDTKYKFLQEEVYLNKGESLSGSSVASYFHTDSLNRMLVGSVYENKILSLQREL